MAQSLLEKGLSNQNGATMSTVRIPRQQRSMQTKSRIMKAAFQLFARKGIHGTNSKEIVEKAGVSIGSFYSYFKNKKTLLLEMLEEFLDRVYLTIWKQVDSHMVREFGREDIKVIIENVFKAYAISPEFMRQTHALRYSDPDIKRLFDRERSKEVAQIQYVIETNADRLRAKDPYAAAIVIHNAVECVAHSASFLGPKIDESRLIDELTDMIYNYVFREAEAKNEIGHRPTRT